MQDKPYDSTQDELKATILEVVTTMKDLMRLNPLYKEHIQMFVQVHLLIFPVQLRYTNKVRIIFQWEYAAGWVFNSLGVQP